MLEKVKQQVLWVVRTIWNKIKDCLEQMGKLGIQRIL